MRLRTLHVIDSLGAGGAERSLAELLPELPPRGIEPTVVVRHRRREGSEQAVRDAGVEIVHIDGPLPARARAVRRLTAERRIGLVHSTLAGSNAVARLAGIAGPPVLTSLVNTPFADGRIASGNVAPWKLEVVRLAERATAPTLTDHFHAISRAVATHAVETIGVDPDRITVVPRGRDRERLGHPTPERRRATRAALGIDDDTQVVLSIGRREPQKGQWVLVDAVAALRDRGLRPLVLVAGRNGSSSSRLDELVRHHGLDDQVRFLGHREDAPDLLVAADVFAFPSLYEGLGGAVIEAMALETPIVAGDCPAVREVLDDGRGGALVPTGDPVAFADALDAALAGGPAVHTCVAHAARAFQQRHTHTAVVEAMTDLLLRTARAAR